MYLIATIRPIEFTLDSNHLSRRPHIKLYQVHPVIVKCIVVKAPKVERFSHVKVPQDGVVTKINS